METITDTKERRVQARVSSPLYVRIVAEEEGHTERIYLTRAEIAALAAKFPVEGKPVDPGVLEACREMLAAIEMEGADSVRFFDARNSALTAMAAAEGK